MIYIFLTQNAFFLFRLYKHMVPVVLYNRKSTEELIWVTGNSFDLTLAHWSDVHTAAWLEICPLRIRIKHLSSADSADDPD